MVVGATGVGQIASQAVASPVSVAQASGAQGEMPFGGMLRSMMEQTSALDAKASDAVSGLLSGKGVEIHDVMIATQKADMAFELALQVRNKAVGAYQQMMGMQF
jgi:flagellar hook-basal body complex protein FliE